MADLSRLRRLLLAMLRPGPADPALAGLNETQWQALDAMAAEHRLQPLLHAEWSGAARAAVVPPAILSGWAEAYRFATMAALGQKGTLIATMRLLDEAGMQPIALKGAWLAWHAYAAPALRPMRDIDVLVRCDQALAAWHLLHDAGYTAPEGAPDQAAAARDKHLPALITPSGVAVEIHSACWETADQAGHPMPQPRDAALRARAQHTDGVPYPAAQDMLAHLMVHAVYSHWLDVGPLVLTDIDALVRKASPDWPQFWAEAKAEGWHKGAALLLALAGHWRRPGLLQECRCPEPVPQALLDAAPDLMLQTMERRAGARILARLGRDGVGAAMQAKWAEAMRDPARAISLVGRRIRDLSAGLAHADARRKSADMRDLGQWLLKG